MKVKLLILLKSIDGGTGTYMEGLLDLRKAFKPGELKIDILVLDRPNYRSGVRKRYDYLHNQSEAVDKYKATFQNLYSIIKEILWVRKKVDKYQPDIILASNFHAIAISEIVKIIFRFSYRTIDVVQNNYISVIKYKFSPPLQVFVNILLKLILNKSNKVVTVSKYLSRDLHNDLHLKKRPLTIPTLLSKIHLTKKTKRNFKDKIIVSVARLNPQKDHETLLAAFSLIVKRIPQAKLWIVGDGPDKNKLILLAKQLGILSNTKFYNWVQNPKDILGKSSVFALSSNWEGFPLSVIEAMSYSLPIVATNCKYGPSEILQNNKYGFLVEPKSPESLANSVVTLLNDYRKYNHFSNMARIRVLEYAQKDMLLKYKNIIADLSVN